MALKLCVIGCGGIATSCHGPSYVKYRGAHPDFATAACCDVDAARAEAFRARFGFERAYTDMHAMLKAERPDAVCVLVSEHFTASVGQAVLTYGIPMLIEKPPGKDTAQTRVLIEAAKRYGTPHMVAYNRRFLPLNTVCRMWIDGNGGAVQYIRYDLFRYNRDDADFSDTAVHAIDAVRFLTGACYKDICFTYQRASGAHAENVYMTAHMSGGCVAHINICPMSGAVVERAFINCGDSTFQIHMPIWGSGCDDPGSLTEFRGGKVINAITGDTLVDSAEVFETNGFYHENAAFFDAVRSGSPLHPTFEEALQTSLVKEDYAKHKEGGTY